MVEIVAIIMLVILGLAWGVAALYPAYSGLAITVAAVGLIALAIGAVVIDYRNKRKGKS